MKQPSIYSMLLAVCAFSTGCDGIKMGMGDHAAGVRIKNESITVLAMEIQSDQLTSRLRLNKFDETTLSIPAGPVRIKVDMMGVPTRSWTDTLEAGKNYHWNFSIHGARAERAVSTR